MINQIARLFLRPSFGWDPVPRDWAGQYSDFEYKNINYHLIDVLDSKVGGLDGKKILDLGGGPGQYSIEFSKRGANVIWHDISLNYLEIAKKNADSSGQKISYSLGYLDDVSCFPSEEFDFIFCRLCWYYCADDKQFASTIFRLLKSNGLAFIATNTQDFRKSKIFIRRLQNSFYKHFGIKIGHPYPPKGLISRLFSKFKEARVEDFFSDNLTEKILVTKK